MPIHPLKLIEDKIRDLAQEGEYLLYLLLSPFKFKKFPKHIRKVLVVDLFNIGDLIVATPVIRALRYHYPKAQIDMLVKKSMQAVLANNPHLNHTIPYTTENETLQRIQKEGYDLGIILHPGSLKVSFLLLRGGVKYRIGCTKAGITYGKGFFLHKKIFPNNRWQHKSEDNLDVIRAIKIQPLDKHLEIYAAPETEKKMKTILAKKPRPWIGISATSKHWTQQWYPERFAKVANHYISSLGATIIFTGLQNERDQIVQISQHIAKKKNVLDLSGKTSFHELTALIKNLDLLITIDSSPLHIASATNTPVLALFGPTIPTFWGPTGENSSYIWKEEGACVGCRRYCCIYRKDHECMRSITAKEVIAASEKLLKRP